MQEETDGHGQRGGECACKSQSAYCASLLHSSVKALNLENKVVAAAVTVVTVVIVTAVVIAALVAIAAVSVAALAAAVVRTSNCSYVCSSSSSSNSNCSSNCSYVCSSSSSSGRSGSSSISDRGGCP